MIKKSLLNTLFFVFFIITTLTACASKETDQKKDAAVEPEVSETTSASETGAASEMIGFLYIPDENEMSSFINNWKYLKRCDAGENQVDDEQLKVLFSVIGRDDLVSLQMENFLRDLHNKELKQKISSYIESNKLDTPFTQALLKKYNSTEKEYESSGHEEIQYSYMDKEFDENITLYDFNEVHPFDDEFGLLLFNNNWGVLTMKNTEDDSPVDDKHFYLIHGGQTNCLTVSLTEIEGVASKEDFATEINGFIQQKNEGPQKGEWNFYQLNKTGVLARCGVDEYLIYSRIGPDIIPEISAGTFGAYLYSEKYKKIYKYEYFMNFSKINISYELRQRIFDYVRFFTLFGYCD